MRNLLVIMMLVAITLGGCAPAPTSPPVTPGSAVFEGPWATEFQDAYDNATAQIQRDVLADGTITDAEYAELMQAFETCVTGAGLKLTRVGTDGGFAIDGDDQAVQEPVLRRCTDETEGSVSRLYHEQRRNPENLDERTIMAACLVRLGVVDKSYGAKEYEQDFLSEVKPAFFGTDPFFKCSADPLGAQP